MPTDPAKAKPVKATKTKTSEAPPSADRAPAKEAPAPQSRAGTATGSSATIGAGATTTRWLLLLVCAALGVVVGAVGSFAHRATATVVGVAWPTGLFFALCGLVGLLLGLGELLEIGPSGSWRPSRLAGLTCVAVGWLLALLWLTYLGPPTSAARKGDVILANDWRSLAFLFGGMLLSTAALYRAWVANLSARLAAHSKG